MPTMGWNPYSGSNNNPALGFGNNANTNSGSATSNQYTNPNTSPYGGNNTGFYNPYAQNTSGDDWYNPYSGMSQYQMQMQPTAAATVGGTQGHLGQTLSYNPLTGEQDWVNSTEGVVLGSTNYGTGGKGTISYIDPVTGMKTINLNYLMNEMNRMGLGGGGSNSIAQVDVGNAPTFGGITPPEGYTPYEYQQQAVDPSAAIAATQPLINKQMNDMFASAGQKAGQSGWAMSTGYTGDLGEAAGHAANQNAALIANLQYDAAKLASEQFHDQQMQAGAMDFGAWQQSGNWDMDSQMYDWNAQLSAWEKQKQLEMFNAQQQNQYQSDDDQFMQQIMLQIMGGLF